MIDQPIFEDGRNWGSDGIFWKVSGVQRGTEGEGRQAGYEGRGRPVAAPPHSLSQPFLFFMTPNIPDNTSGQ